jgi:hypothetical protein
MVALSEPFADGFQFQPTFPGDCGVRHLKFIQGIKRDF